MNFELNLGKYRLDLSSRTHIMGILNVTPDSFSDGGKWTDVDRALSHAEEMAEAGVDIIDVGGESTRPGSEPVGLEEEKRRVLPVIERLLDKINLPISIDTYKSEVARDCLAMGVQMVNDISATNLDPQMKKVIVSYDAAVVLMHMKGSPKDMQENPHYTDLIQEITDYLKKSIHEALKAGIKRERIVVDPGIGFGKTAAHNLEIMKRLENLKALGCPILIGPSRKSVIGKVLDLPTDERLEGTAACVAICILNGANIVRVHDAKEMRRVVRMTDAVKKGLAYELA